MKQKTLFLCSDCGYESPKWFGKCPSCGAWNTLEEQAPQAQAAPVKANKQVGRNDPCPCGSGKKYKNCHGKGLV